MVHINESAYTKGRLWTMKLIKEYIFADWVQESYINKLPMNAVNDKMIYIIGEFISPDFRKQIYRLTFQSMEYKDVEEGEVFKLIGIEKS